MFAVLRGILNLAEGIDTFRPETKPIEIRRSLTALGSEIRGAGLQAPVLESGSDVVGEFGAWAGELLEALASGSPKSMSGRQ